MTWPESQASFLLTSAFCAESPGCFSPVDGRFYSDKPDEYGEVIHFYWLFSAPVLVNNCRDYCCRIDSQLLSYGQTRVLKPGATLQIGHFQLQIQHVREMSLGDEALLKRAFGDAMSGQSPASPELEGLLPHMGQHIDWSQGRRRDDFMEEPLKNLAQEYKNVLLWGAQPSAMEPASRSNIRQSAPESHHFQTLRENMSNQTVTDCILGTPCLINKACDELDISKQSDILCEEELKQDILLLVAPAHFNRKPVTFIPGLMLKELYKTGLDTLL